MKKLLSTVLIQPKSLIFIFVTIALIVFVSAVIELNQSKKELFGLMEKQSHTTLEALAIASENAIEAYDEILEEANERLFNNAAYIKYLYEQNLLSNSALFSFANSNNIFRISVFNKNGKKIFTSHKETEEDIEEAQVLQEVLIPLFEGEVDTLTIGIKKAQFESGYRYSVAVAARNRSAIVLNIDAAELLEFRKKVGFGSLLNKITYSSNIIYIAIQDTNSVIAAAGNIIDFDEIDESAFLSKSIVDSIFQWRILEADSLEIFEAVHPFVYKGNIAGVFRIGLSLETLDSINKGIVRRIIVIGIVLLFFGSAIITLIFVRQNFNVLKKQYLSIQSLSNQIFENVNDSIIVLDENNYVKFVNESVTKLFGKSKNEIVGRNLCVIIEKNKCGEILNPEYALQQFELLVNEKIKFLIISKSKLSDENGKENTVLVISDFSELKMMENQIQRKERLAAMGELASGVAHEIRNPLNSIGTIVQQLRKDFKPKENGDEYDTLSELVYKEVKRINNTIESFLKFAKPLPLTPTEFDTNNFFNEIKNQYKVMLNAREITFENISNKNFFVYWDRNQIQQVFVNLIENAVDAMTGGGKIIVRVNELPQNSLIIEFSDTGKGISEETIPKIFNLYFTTKAEGNGIGLSIVQKIINEHGGEISVQSKKDNGTKFIIVLPKRIG